MDIRREYRYPYNLICQLNSDKRLITLKIPFPKDRLDGLQHVINTLIPIQKYCVTEVFINNKTFEEVGSDLQISDKEVERVLGEAIECLKEPSNIKYIERGLSYIEEISKRREENSKTSRLGPENVLIKNLYFTSRTHDGLTGVGLRTLKDVIDFINKDKNWHLKIQNFGRKSVLEVYKAVEQWKEKEEKIK